VAAYINLDNYNCSDNTATDDEIWIANVAIAAMVVILIFAKIFLFCLLIKSFYGSTGKFIAIAQKQEAEKYSD
jgi:hypothetical protein